ncbi:hypothetical protein Plhal304r1_c035g0109261 [Plasmopara halstedii]
MDNLRREGIKARISHLYYAQELMLMQINQASKIWPQQAANESAINIKRVPDIIAVRRQVSLPICKQKDA